MNNEQSGNIYIIEATSDYKKIHKSLIENPNIDCLTLGIYTKLVVLGLKWKLNINGLSKYLNISDTKIRQSIKLLEQEGYIVRIPQRDERGRLQGWNYQIYPSPVNEQNRSHAGIKTSPCTLKADNTVNRQHGEPTTRITDKAENGEDINNILNKSIDLIDKETKDIYKAKFDFLKALIEIGVEENIAKDWLLVRKNKKASNTKTAFTRIKNELEKSNGTPTECITFAVVRSWAGYEADWYNKEHPQQELFFNNGNNNNKNVWQL